MSLMLRFLRRITFDCTTKRNFLGKIRNRNIFKVSFEDNQRLKLRNNTLMWLCRTEPLMLLVMRLILLLPLSYKSEWCSSLKYKDVLEKHLHITQTGLNLLPCLVIRFLIKSSLGNCFIAYMLKLQISSRLKCTIITILGSSSTLRKKSR
jgi:hypothetical protein